MAFEFHKNKEKYFDWQYQNSRDAIVPFVEDKVQLNEATRVLEIGCAEAGVLKAFIEKGCQCVGIELQESRIDHAKHFMKDALDRGQIKFIARNIYDIDIETELDDRFDLIVLKDVIEHIHDQEKIMAKLQDFLKPGGHIFFGFPAWQMPFGGHQQLARTKIISKLPWIHLLPMPLYRALLKMAGEKEDKVYNLCEIKETRISLEKFERISKRTNYTIEKKLLYLVRPIYKFKFGLKIRKQNSIIAAIPYFRNFLTSAGFYLVKGEK